MKNCNIFCSSYGYALTELIVVVAIIGILLSIATIGFSQWVRKYQLEKQVTQLQAELSEMQLKAITTKREHRAILDVNKYTFKRYSSLDEPTAAGTVIRTTNVSYPIQQTNFGTNANATKIIFGLDGFLKEATNSSGTSILIGTDGNSCTVTNTPCYARLVVGDVGNSSSYDCINVYIARINLGKMSGGTCVPK